MTDDSNDTSVKRRRVTAQMVADAAGVSRSAVSRAFTEGTYIDSEKRSHIRKIADRLGYQPNALAAGLQGGRSHLVAIFVGDMRSPYDTAFVTALVGKLNGLNKWPILIDGSDERASHAAEEVLKYPLDAMILRGGSMSAEVVAHCSKFGVSMISSGRPVDAEGVDNVFCRNDKGMQLATELLLQKGRRRFAFIGGPSNFYSSALRRAGVIETLENHDMHLIAEHPGDYTAESAYAAAQSILSEHKIDALICANDASAIGALAAARELNLSIPDDLSVVGFDNIAMSKWPMFNLTTVNNPIDVSVAETIKVMESRLNNPSKPSETILVEPNLVLRGTH